MNYKLYYWADDLNFYFSDNHIASEQAIEIKRLNFFIGKNNAGKSRFYAPYTLLIKIFVIIIFMMLHQKYLP